MHKYAEKYLSFAISYAKKGYFSKKGKYLKVDSNHEKFVFFNPPL